VHISDAEINLVFVVLSFCLDVILRLLCLQLGPGSSSAVVDSGESYIRKDNRHNYLSEQLGLQIWDNNWGKIQYNFNLQFPPTIHHFQITVVLRKFRVKSKNIILGILYTLYVIYFGIILIYVVNIISICIYYIYTQE
jgi:hypothetical protein